MASQQVETGQARQARRIESQQVVISGGGPVGLWLAAELRLNDISVTVLETRTEIDDRSKALTVHPRGVEVLASRGIHQRFLDESLKISTGHFANLSNRLDFSVLDTPFPYTLFIPQARTEALFEEYARGLGATVRRGHRVAGFTEHADSVTVRVEGPEGPYEIEAEYIAGCDGTRSTVREVAGIEFPGTSSTCLGWLGDVLFDNPPAPGFNRFNERGGLMVVPLPDNRWRIAGTSPDSVTTEWPGDFTLDELREKVVDIAGDDFGMRDPSWLSRYGNATRLATHYRRGRVVLAGDAAHQHFPTGGVGMNVGFQDAFNLGWKLAATIDGWAPDGLLDSYHTDRYPVGEQLMEHSRAQTYLFHAFSPEGLALRDLLSRMVPASREFSDVLAGRLTALDVAYPSTDPTAHPVTGTRAPDLPLTSTDGTLFGALRADSYVLLDLTEDGALADRAQRRITVHTGAPDRTRPAWADVRAALIRPDGHVTRAWTEEDDTKLGARVDAVVTTALGR
ncbi:FAD-dependent monooxygenase [Streptomyces sp. NBC_01478]|uniref:FAD-dependent monooxygenase n=1 Tax=Streptomyces sp. NBC_01478 TaxID=2903882 RepID=UPI002E337BFA|nr:FAD-dependent monooxygenase [Streptomyces sp. NBC_01478]